jgi:PAS domain S-box-containing protein
MDKTPRLRDELGITLFEEAGDALFLFDPVGETILDANPMAESLSGFSHEEFLGAQVDYLFRSTISEVGQRFRKALKNTVRFHSQEGFLLRQKKEGSWIPVNLTVTRLHVQARTLGLITARDISERQALSRKLVNLQEEERRLIALELHDEIGQVLTALRINLERLREPGEAAFPGRLQDSLDLIDGLIDKVRSLSLDLRPVMLDLQGLDGTIGWLLDQQALRARVTPHLASNVGGRRFAPELETALFRIAQQALTNVVRHAGASHVWLTLDAQAGELGLTVQDDGCGFDTNLARQQVSNGRNFGLLGMQERISLVGGDIRIDSRPGEGTTIQARVSLRDRPAPPVKE